MFRLLLLTIFLISSPIFGLIETLYDAEHQCHSGCVSNYGPIGSKLIACKSGELIRNVSEEIECDGLFQAVSSNYIGKIVQINVNCIRFMNNFKQVV